MIIVSKQSDIKAFERPDFLPREGVASNEGYGEYNTSKQTKTGEVNKWLF